MIHKKLRIISVTLAIVVCAGCRREAIRVYVAPKDAPAPEMAAHNPHDGHNHGTEQTPAARPQLAYKLPNGWKESPAGRMSVASFSIAGEGGKEAEVTVTPLGMLAGREADVVNMFRERVGLQPLSPEEVAKDLREVQVGNEKGKLFEIIGKSSSNEAPQRIITAIAHRSDASWFYRLSGDTTLVEAQKPAFIEFLKSIEIKEAAASTQSAQDAPKGKWNVPSGWKALPAGQMQFAKFSVPERNGAKAEVSVSVFPNDTGGTLANVNRWRRQMKLSEVGENELAALAAPLDPTIPGSIVTDMTNNNQRLVGAIVPRGGQWWFYKLLGGTEAVAPERDNFIRFAQTAP